MAIETNKFISEINEYINKNPARNLSEWYVGITNDVERRLFTEHKVEKNGGIWIHGEAINDNHSRHIEKNYLEQGLTGGGGGGDSSAVHVYCYKRTTYTEE